MPVAVEIKEIPASTVMSIRANVAIEDLDDFVAESISDIRDVLTASDASEAGCAFTLYHDWSDPASNLEIEVCVPCSQAAPTTAGYPVHEVSGGCFATTTVRGAGIEPASLFFAFDAVVRFAADHGLRLLGAPREIYLLGDEPAIEIAFLTGFVANDGRETGDDRDQHVATLRYEESDARAGVIADESRD